MRVGFMYYFHLAVSVNVDRYSMFKDLKDKNAEITFVFVKKNDLL